MQRKQCITLIVLFLFLGLISLPVFSWERGLNAGSWEKGATLRIYIEDIPADAPAGTSDAIDEAIKEWNDAQAPFGGLKLVRAGTTKENADIHISWDKNGTGGGTKQKDGEDKKSNGFGKETVRMTVGYGAGTNVRGITRILKHELGHAEGLGHSAASELMKKNAYSSREKKQPTVADINSDKPYIDPTADDKAGKKSLWGTEEKLSISEAESSVNFDGTKFIYDYRVQALDLPGLIDPVTEFTIDLLPGITMNEFSVTSIPLGWHAAFADGVVESGGIMEDGEANSPSLLRFLADSDSFGIHPGEILIFQLTSLLSPEITRAFTNSPNFDSDEFFSIQTPFLVPEPNTLLLLISLIFIKNLYSRKLLKI